MCDGATCHRGRFIVFEGLDGSGKTTQLRLLSEQLTKQNILHIVTREPTATNAVGRLIREALQGVHTLENETLALLFAADRYQHVKNEIKPALQAGQFVLCDRYYYSNFAYQGQGGEDEAVFERLLSYNAQVMAECVPDVTFFIDVEPEECLRRLHAAREKMELYENLEALVSVRAYFRAVFARLAETDNIVTIGAQGLSEAEIAKKIGGVLWPC